MQPLIQPGAGVAPLLSAVRAARKSIELMIFRFDERELELALGRAVARGVSVHALIAHSNNGGEKSLRTLEGRLRSAGVTVARTAEDLTRYHGKMMIVDRRALFLMAFNYTRLDIDHSRSFGVITRNKRVVREAARLFEADMAQKPYKPALENLVVSPFNARKRLTAFIRGARKQLLIYDGKLTDPQMVRLLRDQARAGVEVRVIGRLGKSEDGVKSVRLASAAPRAGHHPGRASGLPRQPEFAESRAGRPPRGGPHHARPESGQAPPHHLRSGLVFRRLCGSCGRRPSGKIPRRISLLPD
jgi:phosphatidylserine/phosphatidylglycerophosphate/cardiolipin synthase-like enzyme